MLPRSTAPLRPRGARARLSAPGFVVLHFFLDVARAQLLGLVLAAALLQVLGVAFRLRDIRAALPNLAIETVLGGLASWSRS